DHRAMAPLREDIAPRYAEVARDDLEDVLDLDPPRLDAVHEIADHRLCDVDGDRRAHVLPRRMEPGYGALQLPPALLQPVGQQLQDVAVDLEGRVELALLLHPLLEDA